MNDRALRLVLAGSAGLAGAIAAYLVVVHYRAGALVCATSGCETVQRSRYAELLGIPVAAFGLGTYVLLFASSFTRRPLALTGAAGLAVTAVLFAQFLAYVQVAVIHAICMWCVAADSLTLLVATAAVLRVAGIPPGGREDPAGATAPQASRRGGSRAGPQRRPSRGGAPPRRGRSGPPAPRA
jgi:uncharacterized membrane protein